MLPIIAGIALVGAGLWIFNELEEETASQRKRWKNKRAEVERSIEWHEEQIIEHLDDARESYDFTVLIDMHYSCVKVADQAYSLLKDARYSLDKIGEAIVKTKIQRDTLLIQKKEAKSKAKRDDIELELMSIQELRKKLFNDKDEIKLQRDSFFNKVKDLNGKTHALKISIKERTGSKGKDWYKRLEERKARRRNNA